MFGKNRIQEIIDSTGIALAKQHSGEKLAEMGKKLDMALDEFCVFQEVKSLAQLHGKLSLEEAQTIYGFLGTTTEHFNQQSTAVKVVLTQVFVHLLAWKKGGCR